MDEEDPADAVALERFLRSATKEGKSRKYSYEYSFTFPSVLCDVCNWIRCTEANHCSRH